MNMKDWHNSGKFKNKYKWATKTRKIQRSLQYNPDPDATVIHHLRDTEEQRKYNDEHYELWGFEIDENGNEHFEYGKYVIFVTKEEHRKIHACSEETRNKLKALWKDPEHRNKTISAQKASFTNERREELSKISKSRMDNPEYKANITNKNKALWQDEKRKTKAGQIHKQLWQDETYRKKTVAAIQASRTEEFKEQLSICMTEYYKNNPVTDETKSKLSSITKNLWQSNEFREKMSAARAFHKTEQWREQCKQTSKILSDAYKEYKSNGGILKWNDFQKHWKKFKMPPKD